MSDVKNKYEEILNRGRKIIYRMEMLEKQIELKDYRYIVALVGGINKM